MWRLNVSVNYERDIWRRERMDEQDEVIRSADAKGSVSLDNTENS